MNEEKLTQQEVLEEVIHSVVSKNVGKPRTIRRKLKIGRNELCPCKSGKKFKDCHYRMMK